MTRLVPRRPAPDAHEVDRLRYVLYWAITGAVLAVPVWAVVFLFMRGVAVVLIFAAVTTLTLLNLASLRRKIDRAKRR
jgi:hypothetical protein